MTAREILRLLKRGRRSGKGWVAQCPAHDDSKPSLSLSESEGRVLLHCHAGCPSEAVVRALGIDMSDLFTDTKQASPRIVATYRYEDENGKLLFEVVRYDPKGFKQRRPNGDGGWIWNLNETRRVLYNLPAVIRSDLVLICEGEKDCDCAARLRLVATCNPGGAGKWRPEYSQSLRGKCVLVIPDRDRPGRKHAQDLASSLMGVAKSVKIVEPPIGKDLSDWVASAASSAREQLLKLVDATSQPVTAEPERNPNAGQVVAERPIRATGDMLPWYTGKPCEHTRHSHINMSVFDSRWEASEAFELDRSPYVAAWVKNDHLGFEITYSFRGIIRKFRPDYLVRLTNRKMLVLEVKGQDNQEHQTKREFLGEWVRAINGHGGFGEWAADVSRNPTDIHETLIRHNG
ncbi:MAG: hypothetical protein ABSD98_11630 [Candidatus Korobacteraceae bacterium]|jgi:hypothetical protein